ncbi:MAG: hypothetical protein R6V58_10430, partial [Planctomycetota bacterium]
MRHVRLLLCLLLLAVSPVGQAGDVGFKAGPTVKKDGDRVVISFELARPTDVEVAVLDPKGAVVHHVAAGRIGGGARPPAPLGKGLSQKLTWDGKDDLGEPARGGPFQVRVRAGLSVAFDGIIGDRRVMGPQMLGIATDDEGHVYVATGLGVKKDVPTIKVFDRDG